MAKITQAKEKAYIASKASACIHCQSVDIEHTNEVTYSALEITQVIC